MEKYSKLPLENAYNIRELGGYTALNNKNTEYHRFLRADDTSKLSDSDVNFLIDYGVRTVIDLRSDKEANDEPDRLVDISEINYVRIPYLGKDLTDVRTLDKSELSKGLAAMYIGILESKELTKEIFESIAKSNGCVMFHCTAGKDRTGVLAMLLLALAGVSKEDCVKDYEKTYKYLTEKPGYLMMVEQAKKYNMDHMLYSKPEDIAACIDYLYSTYGTAKNYLLSCGVTEVDIDRIINKILSSDIVEG